MARTVVFERLWKTAAVVGLAVVVGVLVTDRLSAYNNFTAGTIAVAAIASIGLNLLVGNAGLISLATPAFMAIGGYGAGIILQHTSFTLAGALIIPVVVAVIVGGVVGLLAVRLRGFYLGLATLGLLEAIQYFLQKGGTLVGGGYGFAMPEVNVIHVLTVQDWSGLSAGAMVLVAACVWSIRRSAVGRGLALMREHETVAACTGLNLLRLKVGAFAISAGLGALAGVLSGFVQGAVSPGQFDLTLAVSQLAFIVFGGLGSVPGAIVGTVVLMAVPDVFSSLGQNEDILYAAVLLGVVILAPRGMVPLATDVIQRARRRMAVSRPLPAAGASEAAPVRDPARVLTGAGVRSTGAGAGTGAVASRRTPSRPGRANPAPPSADGEHAEAIKFAGVEVRYGGVVAVSEFSLAVRPGEVHGLIGPNGAGKSSAVAALFGLVRLTAGTISVRGKRVQGGGMRTPPWGISSLGVGRTFQTPVAGRGLTVLEAVQNGSYGRLHGGYVRTALRTGAVLQDERHSAEVAERSLDAVRFGAHRSKPVDELTLGELRRLELARVLATDPGVIVLDEPTSGMELTDAEALFSLLEELAGREQRAVLVVEHNVQLIFSHSHTVTVMNLGRVIASGDPDAVASEPIVKEAYLGRG